MTKLVEKDANHTVEEDNIVPPPLYNETEGPQVVTADTARQAPLGKPVLWVVVVGIVLVAIGFLATWMFTPAPPVH